MIGQLKGYIGELRLKEAQKVGTVNGGRVQDQFFDDDDDPRDGGAV